MLIIIYDRINETQRHFTDHTDLIQCLSLCGEFAVSGQKSGKFKKARAQVRLWNLETLETLQVFNEKDQRLVTRLLIPLILVKLLKIFFGVTCPILLSLIFFVIFLPSSGPSFHLVFK